MTLMGDFNYGILDKVSHRPWPMPETPWIMTQTWNDLLFAHWPVEVQLLAASVPQGLELDLFDGEAWLGIVPFHMTNVAPRLVPALPWISAFPELNVRTYVRLGDKPGVYFFSLDAGNPVAVGAARALFHLPYYTADMRVQLEAGVIRYESRRGPTSSASAEFAAQYHPIGNVYAPQPGSLDHFLTERYCLYTVDPSGQPQRLEIHHPPWPLQSASATITANTMAEAVGVPLPRRAPLLHFAKRQDMVAWASTPVE
jgi:uncharacterized protein YqjF (DUF2071 family)